MISLKVPEYTPYEIARIIRYYRKLNIAWYINQASGDKCDKVNLFQKRIERIFNRQYSTLNVHGVYNRLYDMFLKAHNATLSYTPAR